MAERKRAAKKAVKAPADPAKPKGLPRKRRAFIDSQLNAGRVLAALQTLGWSLSEGQFRTAYEAQSNRKRAFKNDPAALRQRLAELEGRVAEPAAPYVNGGAEQTDESPSRYVETELPA